MKTNNRKVKVNNWKMKVTYKKVKLNLSRKNPPLNSEFELESESE